MKKANTGPSQPAQVYQHLKTRGKINPMQALADYRIYRLAAIIHVIRARFGDDAVRTEELTGKDGRRYAVYHPNKERLTAKVW